MLPRLTRWLEDRMCIGPAYPEQMQDLGQRVAGIPAPSCVAGTTGNSLARTSVDDAPDQALATE